MGLGGWEMPGDVTKSSLGPPRVFPQRVARKAGTIVLENSPWWQNGQGWPEGPGPETEILVREPT